MLNEVEALKFLCINLTAEKELKYKLCGKELQML